MYAKRSGSRGGRGGVYGEPATVSDMPRQAPTLRAISGYAPATLYCYIIYVEIWDHQGPGVTKRRNGHSDYATTVTMMMVKDDLCPKRKVKLIFEGT